MENGSIIFKRMSTLNRCKSSEKKTNKSVVFRVIKAKNSHKKYVYTIHTIYYVVVYRVSKSRFRVGSGYHKLGFGSGTGITLLFEPRYRVPSGNIRVSESLENLSKMIILFYFCEQVFEKSSKLPAISFSFKAKTF